MFFTNIFSTRYIHPALPPYGILVQGHFPDGWATISVVSPLSHGKNAVALLVKKILVSNFPLSTFWMWYMIFFRKSDPLLILRILFSKKAAMRPPFC